MVFVVRLKKDKVFDYKGKKYITIPETEKDSCKDCAFCHNVGKGCAFIDCLNTGMIVKEYNETR